MKREIKQYGKSGKYLEYTPEGEIKGVIFYMHGLGEVGTDINQVEVNEIPKLLKNGLEIPYIVIAPQVQTGTSWSAGILKEFLNKLDAYNYPKHVTGLSLGGIGTIAMSALAYAHNGYKPGYFKTIGICCGKTSTSDMNPFLGTPVKWWHGTCDSAKMPFNNAVAFTSKLAIAGGDVTLYPFTGAGHNIWGKVYNPSFVDGYFNWLLQHK